eukprot:CAMPEP_0174362670 /NCGR_PEP_ID=MMETSP0811_2-20130205/65505_1 /TAXON_ID=73025 ORGANISM="Eutreptiella gymnastica-like, Strain CCMP1594" /NCGR_SAMPLE_ID=MMETSP0811_2 /ASSEMBLY_ACC=CAM_ASM_000667 /LENGTH=60 /DNA_ID=CAMNT_0015500607 /DNA_START=148 /DNA_END=327 /DNA_ORIENTATION=-
MSSNPMKSAGNTSHVRLFLSAVLKHRMVCTKFCTSAKLRLLLLHHPFISSGRAMTSDEVW